MPASYVPRARLATYRFIQCLVAMDAELSTNWTTIVDRRQPVGVMHETGL